MVIDRSGGGFAEARTAISPPTEPNAAQICGSAADRIAQARMALERESLDPALALAHLDAAISCLQGLSRRAPVPETAAANTVLPFDSARKRQSA